MPKRVNFRDLSDEFRKRSAAAAKGWETRRANQRARMTAFERRSAAAKKGWETRRKRNPEYQRRSAAAKKGWATRKRNEIEQQGGPKRSDLVLRAFYDKISSWYPEPHWSEGMTMKKSMDKETLRSLMATAVQQEGYEEVAKRLEEEEFYSLDAANVILYDSDDDKVDQAFANIFQIVYNRAMTSEESKRVADAAENFQNQPTEYEDYDEQTAFDDYVRDLEEQRAFDDAAKQRRK